MSEEKNGRQCAPYLLITKKKLFFFSFFSLGLFRCYWVYKNWSAVRLAERDGRIHPFFRSWVFGFLWIFPLLEYIGKDCGGKKSFSLFYLIGNVGYWLLDTFFLSLAFFTVKGAFYLDILPLFLLFLEMVFFNGVLSFLLLPAQQKINKAAGFKKEKLVSEKMEISAAEVVFAVGFVAGFVLPALFFFNALYFGYYKEPIEKVKSTVPTVAESMQTSRDIVFFQLYRNLRGYENFCKEAGFELKKYPAAFRNSFHEELEYLEKRFSSQGNSIEGILDALEKEIDATVRQLVLKEMLFFKEILIKQVEMQRKGRSPVLDIRLDNLRVKDGEMPMMQVCSAFDEYAEGYFSRDTDLKSAFQRNVIAF